jgi:hypothetical protein
MASNTYIYQYINELRWLFLPIHKMGLTTFYLCLCVNIKMKHKEEKYNTIRTVSNPNRLIDDCIGNYKSNYHYDHDHDDSSIIVGNNLLCTCTLML